MNETFDALSKAFATRMPRRRALKLMVGSVAAGALGLGGWTAAAAGAKTCDDGGTCQDSPGLGRFTCCTDASSKKQYCCANCPTDGNYSKCGTRG